MEKTVKKTWRTLINLVANLIVALAVLLAVALAGVRLVGLQVFTVLSGSMEPTCPVGSLVYVRPVDYRHLEEGDIITFLLDADTVVTHRITQVVPDEAEPDTLRYRTKGDANDAEDGSLVDYRNVIGTVVFTIPYLGYFADFIQNPPGSYAAASAGAVLLLLVFLPDLFFSADRDKEKRKAKHKSKRLVKP